MWVDERFRWTVFVEGVHLCCSPGLQKVTTVQEVVRLARASQRSTPAAEELSTGRCVMPAFENRGEVMNSDGDVKLPAPARDDDSLTVPSALSGSSVIDVERVDTQRAEQSWLYACIAIGIWVCMSLFLWLRGYSLGAGVGTLQTFVMLVLMQWHRNKTTLKERRRFTNLFLGFSCAAIFLISVAHPNIRVVLFFLPLGIVMAAQVLGVGRAAPWLIVNLAAFLSFELVTGGSEALFSGNRFDWLVLTSGIAIGSYLSCYQSERLFRNRTSSLVALSSDLHRLATTDSLTGLMNRHQFQEQLSVDLQEARSQSNSVALMSIDMDGFKKINDTLGHLVGDATLREIAKRLTDVARPHSLFRLGGDEFCVIMREFDSPQAANDLADAIHRALCAPYRIEKAEFHLGASVGVALFPDHANSSDDLVAFADTAMYHAKENMLGICGYDAELTEHLVATTQMQSLLSGALDRDEFFVVYQPQIDVSSGTVVGVEALLRWNCHGEVVSPGVFVPLLERTRLIVPVGRWVLREVCRQLRAWTDEGYDTRASVNVSVVQFNDPGFSGSVEAVIDEFGVDPAKLDFEVTEGVLIHNIEEVVGRLTELKKRGSTISIDDFGTGYSSLAYLRQLPLDKLKIDRDFVKDIPAGDDGTIASSIIALAQALGLTIVAEGVETQEQLEFLSQRHCEQFQGFLHSRPLAPADVVHFLPHAADGYESDLAA